MNTEYQIPVSYGVIKKSRGKIYAIKHYTRWWFRSCQQKSCKKQVHLCAKLVTNLKQINKNPIASRHKY